MREDGATVRSLLARGDFRRLFGTRLLSQFGDGVFQAALAGTVLFNPQRATDPLDVAAAFAVLLLPWSVLGPFAGVLLDRWSRRTVLLRANVVRALLVAVAAAVISGGVDGVPFYLAGLAVFSVNRFVLAALSAGLPHTTDALVPANALSTTSGSVATVAGGGAALLLLPLVGSGDAGYAAIALASALPYLAASAVVSGFDRGYLGPDGVVGADAVGVGVAGVGARGVVAGLVDGARHAWARPPAAAALAAIGLHRVCFGLLTLMTLLLHRGPFEDAAGLLRGGLAGLGQLVAAIAAGSLLAAALTPPAVRRAGRVRWTVGLLLSGAVAQVLLGLPFTPAGVVAGGFVLGLVGQGVKICVDATLQETVDDDFRGRVFSVYDTLFNVAFVGAVVVAALVLPESGRSVPVLLAVGAGYLLAVVAYLGIRRRAPLASPA
ncbi:Major Facilitator Superfamily protein [Blastococcus aggregatus]|uniref:Major Facilitator Superfamily protein n=1 Tax=Blastococcus aggregatus TaxID=38502 RepID=A0A285VEH0_9ACTN|nr:MFS transporter [Blastococcus aggregatus]SOC52347.1 Major Facilitator Superfamily protein [Blastococcus aggregatus]